ncbi:MAG: hypothetical protein WC332_09225 [Clostridia bacterium]|jgi:hypothetical protein
MVETVNLILISVSLGAFAIVPLIPFIRMILNERTKPVISGIASFSIYGIILKNLVFFLIFLIPALKTSITENTLIYSLTVGVVSAFLHVLIRHIFNKKKEIKDIFSFSTGESFIQCIYIGIPISLLSFVYALVINLGGFEYIGITEKLIPIATSLINADFTEYLPYIVYPFYVFCQNWLTLSIFTRSRTLSTIADAASLSIYSYLMLNRLFIMNSVFMAVFALVTLLIFILLKVNNKNRKKAI